MGIIRSTVVVSAKGKVLGTYPKVKARGHAEQVLGDLKELA
ncbi:MAG: bacterioferritin comigratory protein [Deltaproteobacteria bacterium]|nr:bacterioferritin comigratory protein [Deltaproteobacteria bacterium]